MQVLVIGSGGREHALAWKLLQSPQVTQVYCAPGNGGTRQMPRCQSLALAATDIEGLVRFATVQGIRLTVVGPEVPLVEGIVDAFQAAGLTIFGPNRVAAQLEGSKLWAKHLMQEAGIPTPRATGFKELAAALAYLDSQSFPLVVKVDGLAAGKGVTIAQHRDEAAQALQAALAHPSSSQQVVIEEFITGQEVSLLALTDGQTCVPLLPAQDYKRIGDGDTGPNTGGMGAHAPADHLVTPELLARLQTQVLDPTLRGLQQRGILYQGVIYAGLMITPTGDPYVLEYNCRFGDPEAQVILPLLENPLEEVLLACVEGRLAQVQLNWKPGYAACVVMAAPGYPGPYERGIPIFGLAAATQTGALVFHAGTRQAGGQILSDGGRVLCMTGQGASLSEALGQAYAAVEQVQFTGAYCRSDIGSRALGSAVRWGVAPV
ncbi:phosphoribosylamine--glycine ligase [Synechococcus sp. Nb3U1]|uniref:phosphoribosylamine--glycine ligase n=1 Tax=Synechococcus sp. Nb3U1 TaxID=1914529 RepID=UPI001F3A20DA|nr:phosphoribosylamine--glycine ligase [Synechococcus sp. Nb3U1]MCF2971865.1 phosphoribosylamine--glycine ligase [Synechococcus sp. Nb3U1]